MKKIVLIILIFVILILNNINVIAENTVYPPIEPDIAVNPEAVYYIVYYENSDPSMAICLRSVEPFIKCNSQGYPDNNGITYMVPITNPNKNKGQRSYSTEVWPQWHNRNVGYHGIDAYKVDGNTITIIMANYDIGSYKAAKPWDYYISDSANMFNEGQINSLLNMEKKWEQNLNMQFFLKTYTEYIPNEVQDLAAFGNSKSPSGNGSITLYIQDKPDGTYRFGLGISQRAALTMPYGENKHYAAWNILKGSYNRGNLSVLQIENFLQRLYSDILYKPADMNVDTTSGNRKNYQYDKRKRNFSDDSTEEYSLISNKLPKYKVADPSIFNNVMESLFPTHDAYGFYNEYYADLHWGEDWQNDNLHIWFGNAGLVEGTTTPGAIEIPGGDGTEPGTTTPGAIEPGENPPGESDGESSGLLSALWALVKALFSLLVSIFGLIGRALTYTTDVRNVASESSLFNEYIIMAIEFLKNQNIPNLNINLWAVFELIFSSAGIFVLIKLIQKIINIAASGG